MAASRQTPSAGAQAGMVKATAGSLSASSRIRVDSAAALDVRLRGRRRNAAGVLGQRDRKVRGARPRRQQGARQACRESVRVRQALPAVLRRYGASATTPSSRTSAPWSAVVRWATSASSRSATSWCCSASHQRLELQPWQPETQRTAASAVRLDQGRVVHDEARGPEHGRRQGPRARQGLAAGRDRAGGVDDRAHRSDRKRQGRRRVVRGRPVAGRRRESSSITTISRCSRTRSESGSGARRSALGARDRADLKVGATEAHVARER